MLPTYVEKTQFKNPSLAESKLLFYLLVLEGLTTQCELYLVHQTEDLSLLTEGNLRSEKCWERTKVQLTGIKYM